jgi:chemotaxis methyl-accepting protein methylase
MVNHRGLSLQIFASDIDINAIEKARKGLSVILSQMSQQSASIIISRLKLQVFV